ncbi:MAG TPA: sulfatase-like hydrolase/transferase [Rhodanobacteraceae bacterium]|nr:sulfatase-like hydrolase/transferase [Rhodanobacteraceae bacterium]
MIGTKAVANLGWVAALAAPFVVTGAWLGCTVASFGTDRAVEEALSGLVLGAALLLASRCLRRTGVALGVVIYALALLLLAGDAASWVLQGGSFNERFFAHADLRNLGTGVQAYPWAIGATLSGLAALAVAGGFVLARVRGRRLPKALLVPAALLLMLALVVDAPPRRLFDYANRIGHERALAGSDQGHRIRDLLDLQPSRPDDVQATPGRNLLLVYLESLERSYTDESRFPGLTPNINRLRAQGLDFSGFRTFPGATYTIAGLFASQCGAPFLLNSVFGEDIGKLGFVPGNDNTTAASFHSDLACLGDVLHAAGYQQTFVSGVSLGFTNKGEFLRLHGYDEALGEEEIERRHGNALPRIGWGLPDRDVFAEALDGYRYREAAGRPFSMVVETADTHPPSGYMLKGCERYAPIANDMLDAVHCTDRLLGRFLDTLSHEPGWGNTVVVVMSDHLAMRNAASPLYPPAGQRQPLLFVLNAGAGERPVRLLHMDIAPTVLSLLGVHSNARFLAGVDRSGLTAPDSPLPADEVAQAVLRTALWSGREPPTLCRGDHLIRWTGAAGEFDIGGWTLPLMVGGWRTRKLDDDNVLLVFTDARAANLQMLVAGNQDRWLGIAREQARNVFLAAPFRDDAGRRLLALDWLAPNGAWASLGAVADVQAIDLHSPRCRALLRRIDAAKSGERLDFSAAFATVLVPASQEPRPGLVRTANIPAGATPEVNAMFMFARIVARQTGLGTFRITRKRRIFMHPSADHAASAVFDLSGIANLTLAPRINPLLGSCITRHDTGVVGVRISLAGRPVLPRFMVDRDYAQTLPIATHGATRLRVDVDDGNGTADCDWFALGFPAIGGAAPGAVASAALPRASE